MLEPSKPRPSSKTSSVNSPVVIEKCCHMPGRSMKRRSTIFTPFSRANSTTCFGVMRGNLPFLQKPGFISCYRVRDKKFKEDKPYILSSPKFEIDEIKKAFDPHWDRRLRSRSTSTPLCR